MSTIPRSLSHFLTKMSTAVGLFLLLACASLLGTFLPQHLPTTAYLVQYGQLGGQLIIFFCLDHLYSTPWYLVLWVALFFSVSLCLWRHRIGLLTFNIRNTSYLCTHVAMLLIALYALLNSDWLVHFDMMLHGKSAQIMVHVNTPFNKAHSLSSPPLSFQALMPLIIGKSRDNAIIPMRQGLAIEQSLPFTVVLQNLQISHYQNGQVRQYQADIALFKHGKRIALGNAAINHPFVFQGYAFYPVNVSDGGSTMNLVLWPTGLAESFLTKQDIAVTSGKNSNTPQGTVQLDFVQTQDMLPSKNPQQTNAPSLFSSYIQRILKTGPHRSKFSPSLIINTNKPNRTYQLFLVQNQNEMLLNIKQNNEWHTLRIPVNSNDSLASFSQLMLALKNPIAIKKAASIYTKQQNLTGQAAQNLFQSSRKILTTFATYHKQGTNGFTALNQLISPKLYPQDLGQASTLVTQVLIGSIKPLIGLHAKVPYTVISDKQALEYLKAVDAVMNFHLTYLPQIQNFQLNPITVLEIKKSFLPYLLYLGTLLLILGIGLSLAQKKDKNDFF